MLNQNNLGVAQKDSDDLPVLPAKRRLSASAWQTTWILQMVNPLRAPETVETFVQQYSDERCAFSAKPRTTLKLCLTMKAVEMADRDMAMAVFKLIKVLEQQYGPVALIEERPVEQWSLYQAQTA